MLQDTPSETPTAVTPYLDQLAELASPVPNLAATLTTQAEQDDANEENVSFLRTRLPRPVSSARTPHDRQSISHHQLGMDSAEQDWESQRRMRRALEAARYLPSHPPAGDDATFESLDLTQVPEYLQYHGWAPGSSEDEDEYEFSQSLSEIHQSLARLEYERSYLHNGSRPRHGSRRSRIPQLLPTSSAEAVHPREPDTLDRYPATEASLRTTALLQSVRRNTDISSRLRTELQSYVHERERIAQHTEAGQLPRSDSTNPEQRPPRPSPLPRIQRLPNVQQQARRQQHELSDQQRHLLTLRRDWVQAQEQGSVARPARLPVEAYRQRYLENPLINLPPPSRSLDDAIKYLERLRFCETVQESLSSARAGGFGQDGFSANQDFILDISDIEPPPESSWLKIGGVLSGSQHAAGGSALPSYLAYPSAAPPPSSSLSRHPHAYNTVPSLAQMAEPSQPDISSRPAGHHRATRQPADTDECWPVKVTIHSIDYDHMTLSGTMEAFNVPDKSSPTRESSITTFLEGEIIDFNTYTLETKSFNANARVDGTYWRKLEPFKNLTDDEMVRSLVSKKWLKEELSGKWILMRWKGISTTYRLAGVAYQPSRTVLIVVCTEKCFVTPSDAQSSLTISGFYYVCLRRSDGHVEGLYYDPSSTPYQRLSLMPEKRLFPAYQFQ